MSATKHASLPSYSKAHIPLIVVTGVLCLFAWTFWRTAWVADDAFISFRVIDNAVNGLGLTWNPTERVQVYTHPLWLFLHIPPVLLGGSPYWVSLSLSFALLLITLFILMAKSEKTNMVTGAMVVSLLLGSRAFIDYSSSGLENPLTHTLLAGFLTIYLAPDGKGRLSTLATLTGLLYVTRPDAILLAFPCLLFALFQSARQGNLKKTIIPGLFPLIAILTTWTLFSLFYYGTPVPNTALAKVGNGISLSQALSQGYALFMWTWNNDIFSCLLMLAGIIAGLMQSTRLKIISATLLAWMAYVFYVGGDFMGGRFFSASVLISIFPLLELANRQFLSPKRLLLPVCLAASFTGLTVLSPSTFRNLQFENGVADERGFYFQATGAIHNLAAPTRISWHPWHKMGMETSKAGGTFIGCTIGIFGYTAGPSAYIIDPLALSDPFLARLPALPDSRVGHYERSLPPGYIDSRFYGGTHIPDTDLAWLFTLVRHVTQDDLWSLKRLQQIAELNIKGPAAVERSPYIQTIKASPNPIAHICSSSTATIWLWRVGAKANGELLAVPLEDMYPGLMHISPP